jgi:hypothetical protein
MFLQSVLTIVTNYAIIIITIAVVIITTQCTSATPADDKASTLDFICKRGSTSSITMASTNINAKNSPCSNPLCIGDWLLKLCSRASANIELGAVAAIIDRTTGVRSPACCCSSGLLEAYFRSPSKCSAGSLRCKDNWQTRENQL